MSSNLEQTLTDMIQAEDSELYFYETQTVKENDNLIFRVFIKSPNRSITIDDCVKVNNLISPYLDVYPPTSGQYFLEVSSPGIERIVKDLKHFKLSINEKFKIKLQDKTDINGTLIEIDENNSSIKLKEKDNEEIRTILLSDIVKAKTYFDFES